MGGKVLEYEAKTIKREGIRAAQDKQYRNKLYEEYLIDNEK